MLFLRLIKMIIAPLVFATLVGGIAHMGSGSKLGRIFAKTMGWFVSASLVSLLLGLIMVNLLQPGANFPGTLPDKLQSTGLPVSQFSIEKFLTHLIPTSIADAMAQNEIRATRGGIPFGRGALYYLLSNHFYVGEVKYKNEILPGEQPPIMDRALFEAVRQKSLAQWSHRTVARNKSDHLLTGLLFDDAGYPMIPTHATKAGVRYRYYVSTPVLHGEAKTASAGSVSRVPAADIEAVVVKLLKEHLAAKQDRSTTSNVLSGDRGAVAQLVAGIVVYEDRLALLWQIFAIDLRNWIPESDFQ
jgi:hypothetical protein